MIPTVTYCMANKDDYVSLRRSVRLQSTKALAIKNKKNIIIQHSIRSETNTHGESSRNKNVMIIPDASRHYRKTIISLHGDCTRCWVTCLRSIWRMTASLPPLSVTITFIALLLAYLTQTNSLPVGLMVDVGSGNRRFWYIARYSTALLLDRSFYYSRKVFCFQSFILSLS